MAKRKILIVDDLAINRQILKRVLSADYDIFEAANGREAKELLLKNYRAISAVLLDIVMPEINGYELLRQMRSNPVLSQIPVIIVTGTEDSEARVKTLALGANDFVNRPYNPDIIRHCLRNNITLRETASLINTIQRDKLTRIYNREFFFEKAAEMITSHKPDYFILVCFDIDNFKLVNDQFGAAEGDRILKHMGAKLNDLFDSVHGICGRIAGDNFAGLYPNEPDIIEKVALNRNKDILPKDTLANLSFSVGRYIIKDPMLPVSAMYDRAYIAKQSVKGRYDAHTAYFDDSMLDALVREQEITGEMDSAIAERQFEVWFQPQYNHSTGAMIGSEALVRWRHPAKGLISPGVFIPIFEKNGFIYELDKYVWETACGYLRQWMDDGLNPLPVSVNLSRYDVFKLDIVEFITGLTKKYHIPVELLRLEITESAFSKSAEQIISVVKRFIELGFIVEIDDFGSGYSSLNTLKDVPAQVLKLDMRFLEGSENSRRGGNILESIIRMAKWLGMSVIAEGVETISQANYLKSIGCAYVQGYLYARPMMAQEYEALAKGVGKEKQLSTIETVENLDNNSFWDPKSMETLIFNSYVGGACIFELSDGSIEFLRANDKYAKAIGSSMTVEDVLRLNWTEHLDEQSIARLMCDISLSAENGDEVTGEYVFSDLPGCPRETYLRSTMRVIASAGGRYLVYCASENITLQREAEKKEREAEQKRRAAAEQLGIVLANINGGVMATVFESVGTRFIFTNDRYYELLGYTREQYENEVSDVFELFYPDDREMMKKLSTEANKTLRPYTARFRVIRRDGAVRWMRSNVSITAFPNERLPVQLAVITDITKLAEAEESERRTKEQLEAIMKNIDGGISVAVVKDGKAEYIYTNDRYYSQLGYTREEYRLHAAGAFATVHPDDRERVMRVACQATADKKPFSIEYRIVRPDGEIRWILSSVSIMDFPGTDDPVQLAVANDVTEQRLLEQKERQTAAKLQAIMDNVSNGITAVVLGKESNKFLFANNRYYELLGYTKEQFDSGEIDEYYPIHPADLERVKELTSKASQTRSDLSVEFRIVRADGTIRWIGTVITIADLFELSQPVQLAMYFDITEERERDEQLRFLNGMARDLLALQDSEAGIMAALNKLLEYFDGSRAGIFELDPSDGTARNTYEVCAQGVAGKKESRGVILPEETVVWKNTFKNQRDFAVGDVDLLDGSRAAQKEVLQRRGVSSLIAVPLYRDGGLIGMIGIDEPKKQLSQIKRLAALGDFVAVMLTRRDLNARIMSDSQALKTLMDDTPGGFCRLLVEPGKSTRVVYANEGICRLLGMAHEEIFELYGEDAARGVHPDDVGYVVDEYKKINRNGGQLRLRYRLRHGKKGYVWIMVFGRMVVGDNGKRYINAYFTDVSEDVIKEYEQEELLDNIPCGAGLYELDGDSFKIIHLNQRYKELVGRADDEYTDAPAFGGVHPDDRAALVREVRAAIRQNRDASCDMRILNGEGGYSPFHALATITRKAGGSYSLCVAYQPIANDAMSVKDMLPIVLSTIMESTTDLAFAKDRDFRYICASRAFANMLGLESENDMIGKTDFELFDGASAEKFRSDDETIVRDRKSIVDMVECIPSADGTPHYSSTSKYLLRDSLGSVIGVYGIGHDITEYRDTFEKLKLLTESIPGGLATYVCTPESIKLTYFNDGFCRLFGYTREEYARLADQNPMGRIFDEDRPEMQRQVDELISAGKPIDCVYRAHTNGGGYKWINHRAAGVDRRSDTLTVNAALFDITIRQNSLEKLRMEEAENRLAMNLSGSIICRYTIADKTLAMSPEAAKAFALPEAAQNVPDEPIRLGMIAPESVETYRGFFESIIKGGETGSIVFKQKYVENWRWMEAKSSTIFSDDGKPVKAVVSFYDVTDRLEKEAVYKRWQQSMSGKTPESYTLYRCNLSRDATLDEVEGLLLPIHFEKTELKTFNERTAEYANKFVHPLDRPDYAAALNSDTLLANYYRGKRTLTLEYRELTAPRASRWLKLTIELVEYPNSTDVMAYMMYEDIDESKKDELQIKLLAQTDPLTGLLNRKTFESKLEHLITQRKKGLIHALLMFDLDKFKQVNDIFGHEAGDQALIETAQKLALTFRSNDLICRMGGDEFLVCLCDLPDEEVAGKRAAQICARLRKDFGGGVVMTASIGIAICPKDGESFDVLYPKADAALYSVKASGRNSFAFYTAALSAPAPSGE